MAREVPHEASELATPVTTRQEDQQDSDPKEETAVIAFKELLSASWEEYGTPMPANTDFFKADPCPGGVRAKLTVQFPNGQSHSFGKQGERFPNGKQARRTLYRRALSLWSPASTQSAGAPTLPTPGPSNALGSPNDHISSNGPSTQPVATSQPATSVAAVPETRSCVSRPRVRDGLAERARSIAAGKTLRFAGVQTETAAPAAPEGSSDDSTVPGKRSIQVQTETTNPSVSPECSSEGSTVLGKRSTLSEDGKDSESAANAQPREMHGRSYCEILAAYCYESGYAQPQVTFQLHVGEAGLFGRSLYHVSMSVGKEYLSLQRSYDSIEIATERLSEQALNSFGIRPKTI